MTYAQGVMGKFKSKQRKNENNTDISLYQIYLPIMMMISQTLLPSIPIIYHFHQVF